MVLHKTEQFRVVCKLTSLAGVEHKPKEWFLGLQAHAAQTGKCCRVLLQMETLFARGGGIHELMKGRLAEAAVLFSGLSHEESKTVLRCLKMSKIRGEHILQS
jgi:hypothetical protein